MSPTVYLNKAQETPAPRSSAARRARSLPPELLREASVRLGWAGLIYAGGYFLAYWVPFFLQRGTHPELARFAENLTALLSIALGLGIFVLSRYTRQPPQRVLDSGLVFAVFGSIGISVAEFWQGFPRIASVTEYLGVPWECVWILIVPLVAPNTPRKILGASLAMASTGPLVLGFVALVRGAAPQSSLSRLAIYFIFTTYLCAAIAYCISLLVFRYSMRLRKAREIGSYELVRQIGSGGMGDVWVAEHRLLARPAAMKLIRPELLGADPQGRQTAIARFEREARATAALGSTHTVSVYDFGVAENGSFYYVMELLNGLSLDTLVRQYGPIPPARVVHLLRQVCHSLGEAHAAGMIHRDIKPANIFTCRVGPDVDFVKVLDFGLVKRVGPAEITHVTAAGLATGTPAYMSPEVALGQPSVDQRADIYALGCVAYWLLTGEPVFKAPTPMATVLMHVQAEPDPPSDHSALRIPRMLDRLVVDCLAKDPADRPGSAAELDRRLAECVDAAGWLPSDARAWWDRHRPVDLAPDAPTPSHTLVVSRIERPSA
jgi:eukaryotic-like serine/threonine-protein kinase